MASLRRVGIRKAPDIFKHLEMWCFFISIVMCYRMVRVFVLWYWGAAIPWYVTVVSHRLWNENVIRITGNSDKHSRPQLNTGLAVALATRFTANMILVNFRNYWELPGHVLLSANLLGALGCSAHMLSAVIKWPNGWYGGEKRYQVFPLCWSCISSPWLSTAVFQSARSATWTGRLIVVAERWHARSQPCSSAPVQPCVWKGICTLKQLYKQMAELCVSVPGGNILIKQPPVQVISRLRSNSKLYLVFSRWFLLSHSLADDWVLAELIRAVDYSWLHAYLGDPYLNFFRRKKKKKRERKVIFAPFLSCWAQRASSCCKRGGSGQMPRQDQLLRADAAWEVVCHRESETAKSESGKYSAFTSLESLRESQELIFTV